MLRSDPEKRREINAKKREAMRRLNARRAAEKQQQEGHPRQNGQPTTDEDSQSAQEQPQDEIVIQKWETPE